MKYRFFVFFSFFLGLTVARYLVIHYTKASLKRKQDSIKGFVFFLIHFLKQSMFTVPWGARYVHGFAFVPTFFRVTQILHGFYTDFTDLMQYVFFWTQNPHNLAVLYFPLGIFELTLIFCYFPISGKQYFNWLTCFVIIS